MQELLVTVPSSVSSFSCSFASLHVDDKPSLKKA